jgi:hypothetical protein
MLPQHRKVRSVLCRAAFALAGVLVLASAQPASTQAPGGPGRQELSAAEYNVEQLEKHAERMAGKPFDPKRYGASAMDRVKALVEKYPDDPKVKELFERVRAAVKKSRGDVFEVTPEMLAYRNQERSLVEQIAQIAESAWAGYKARFTASQRLLAQPFPAPEPGGRQSEEDMYYRQVVLEDFRYPLNEFTNGGEQYVFVGSARQGFYFVELSNPRWLGAYEALRRYRRQVADGLPERWTVTGTVVGSNVLVPRTGEKSAGDVAQFGWIVRPDAIYVPGRVLAVARDEHPEAGDFSGEAELAELKRPFLTETEVPDDIEPQRLLEIFATAIKEKNFDLYLECIDPEVQKAPRALGRLRSYWDINQRRFAEEYVHVDPFEVGPVQVLRGEAFDKGAVEDFFLDASDRAEILERADDRVEQVPVRIRVFDDKGKQGERPNTIRLRRYGGGRWYVHDGFPL